MNKKLTPKKIVVEAILPTIIGVFLILIFHNLGNLAQANSLTQISVPVDPILASLSQEIDQYDNLLLRAELSPDSKKEIIAKKKYLEAQATKRAGYLVQQEELLKTKLVTIAELTLTPSLNKESDTEINAFNGRLTEFYAPKYKEANFISAWLKRDEKNSLFILAGSLVNEPKQGIVYIENRLDGTLQKYKTGRDEALRIINFEYSLLYLESTMGFKYILNLDTGLFTDEKGRPIGVTTPTPLPAYPAP